MTKAWSPPSDTTLTKPTRWPPASRAVTQPRLCGRIRSHQPTSAFPPWAWTSSTISASVNGPRQRYVTPSETNCGRTAGPAKNNQTIQLGPAPRLILTNAGPPGVVYPRSVPPERPDLDRPDLGDRVAGCDLDGLLQAAALDDVEAADRLLGLGERTVGDDRLPVAGADGARTAGRSQLVAGDPDAPRLDVVQPGEALLVRSVG